MTTPLLHPVGPEPARVYWRRRLVLLLAVVGLVLLVVTLTTRGGRADPVEPDGTAAASAAGEPAATEPAPAATDAPTAGAEPSAEPTGDGDEAPTCEPDQLQVAVATDAASYGADAAPRFTVEATNTSEEPCSVDLALGEQVELLVVSGDDRIWSSRDCQEETDERVVVLEPGGSDGQTAGWQRVRSQQGCPGDLPEPTAGTYDVTATVGDVTSDPARFTLD